jgi:NTP pyrophosphatase (non-canonical NTP hydrolase)
MEQPPNLILTNVNVFKNDLLICDSYVCEVAPEHLAELAKGKNVYHFAPEFTHIDILGFKLCTILRLGKVKSVTVFTKDGSPHGLQIPLVVEEAAEDVGFDKSKIKYFVWEKENLFKVSDESVRKARHLSEIESIISFGKLKNVVDVLRAECPNDKKEVFASVLEHFTEETGELKKAIADGNAENCREELGDILFNVMLFAKIAEEQKFFNVAELFDATARKMIDRHKKIFDK